MAFTGTLEKCKICEKTVYFLEMITADGVTYHKTCFRCSQCNGKLTFRGLEVFNDPHECIFNKCGLMLSQTRFGIWKVFDFTYSEMSTYSSLEGVLFCKPHFEQKFKERGGLPKVTSGTKSQEGKAPSKLAAFFSGTQDKCAVCKKTVYPLEKVTVEGEYYHKGCFRCTQGGCFLTPSNYAALDGNLFCKPHFAQLFKEKGSYAHLKETATMKKTGTVSTDETPADEDAKPEEAAPEEEE